MFRSAKEKKFFALTLLCGGLALLSACKKSSFDDAFDPRAIKEMAHWFFDNASDYEFNASHISVSGGKAQLRQVDAVQNSAAYLTDGAHVGTFIDSTGKLSLAALTDLELSPAWTPQYAAIVGYWHLNGAQGNITNGAVVPAVVGSDGTAISANNTGLRYVKGKLQEAVHMDGVDTDSVSIPHSPAIDQQNVKTMQVWLRKRGDAFGGDTYSYPIRKGNNASLNAIAMLVENGDPAVTQFLVSQPTTVTAVSADATIQQNVWTHVVGVIRGNKAEIYINGNFVDDADLAELPSSSGHSLFFGGLEGNWFRYNGDVDEVALWSAPLTASEIRQIYNVQKYKYAGETTFSAEWTPRHSNLVGYWSFDNTLDDESASANHGTAQNGAVLTATSKVGSHAAIFDGTNDYISTATANMPSGGAERSFAAWVNVSDLPNAYGALGGVIIGENAAAGQKFYFEMARLGGTWWLYTDGVNAANNISLTASQAAPANTWTHIAFSLGSGNQWNYYRNGQWIKGGTFPIAVNTSAVTSVTIGQRLDITSYAEFKGSIDEVAVWNTQLSATDVRKIYDRQKQKFAGHYESPLIDLGISGEWTDLTAVTSLPYLKEFPIDAEVISTAGYSDVRSTLSDGIVGLWHFNESAWADVANEVADESGYGNHARARSGALTAEGGLFRKTGEFDGVNGYVEGGNTPSFQAVSADVSVQAWIKTTEATYKMIFTKYQGGAGGSGIVLSTDVGGFARFDGRDAVAYRSSGISVAKINDGNWHHVLGQRSGSIWKIFVDGKLENSFDTGNTTSIANTSQNIFIGQWSNNYYFKGSIDEVAVWSRALSDAEVLQLYRRGGNRIQYQVRSCTANPCNESTEAWKGPDGTSGSYFSELHNYASIDGTGNGSGDIGVDGVSLNFANFAAAGFTLLNNRYFQYRVVMESDEANSLCLNAFGVTSACMPDLKTVTIGPTGRYYGGSPVISNKVGVNYETLLGLVFTKGGSCTPQFQISNNGTDFYYWNGNTWTVATNASHASAGADVSAHISSFAATIGKGLFFFKAFLVSDTTQSCEIDSALLHHTKEAP